MISSDAHSGSPGCGCAVVIILALIVGMYIHPLAFALVLALILLLGGIVIIDMRNVRKLEQRRGRITVLLNGKSWTNPRRRA